MTMHNDSVCPEMTLESMFYFTFAGSDWLHQLEVYPIFTQKNFIVQLNPDELYIHIDSGPCTPLEAIKLPARMSCVVQKVIPLQATQYFKPTINQSCGSSELKHHVCAYDVLSLWGTENYASSEVRC